MIFYGPVQLLQQPPVKIIYCLEKCKTKWHIFGLLSVTSMKCTHVWIAPVYFLGMVKNEGIVTILEHFQFLFLLLFLLNGENVFIFGCFKGKTFRLFDFVLLYLFSSSYVPPKRGKSSGMGKEGVGEAGGERTRKPQMWFILFKW